MNPVPNIEELNEKIQQAKALLKQLNDAAQEFPSLARNSERALTSIKMMELNISDLLEFEIV